MFGCARCVAISLAIILHCVTLLHSPLVAAESGGSERYSDVKILSKMIKKPPTLEEGHKPHISITCPENAGCTMFATILCFLLDAKLCRPDHGELGYLPMWDVPKTETFVHKSVFTGFTSKTVLKHLRRSLRVYKDDQLNSIGYFENTESGTDSNGNGCAPYYELHPQHCGLYDVDDFNANAACTACGGGVWIESGGNPGVYRNQFEAPYKFTHHIVLFKDPVQNFMSLSRKYWCENHGGFREKWHNAETTFKKVASYNRWQDSSNGNADAEFSAVVFVEDVFDPQTMTTLFERLGLLKYIELEPGETTDDLLELFTKKLNGGVSNFKLAHPDLDITDRAAFVKFMLSKVRQFPEININFLRLGNYDGRKPSNKPYPWFCEALRHTYKLAPTLFSFYHPRYSDVYTSNISDEEAGVKCDVRSLADGMKQIKGCKGHVLPDGTPNAYKLHKFSYGNSSVEKWLRCEGGCVCCSSTTLV
eukprot:m.220898 g.220898  ORF g.220898 m.220898 type:complete len:477 (-) comp33332_c0_seq6:221-1651(-)